MKSVFNLQLVCRMSLSMQLERPHIASDMLASSVAGVNCVWCKLTHLGASFLLPRASGREAIFTMEDRSCTSMTHAPKITDAMCDNQVEV